MSGACTMPPGGRLLTTSSVLVFMRVDSPHGPLEVAVGFDSAGAIRGVEVTKATVETKPWIVEALRAGLTDHYRETPPVAAPSVKGRVGTMSQYMAELVDRGVAHAGAAYRLFYR